MPRKFLTHCRIVAGRLTVLEARLRVLVMIAAASAAAASPAAESDLKPGNVRLKPGFRLDVVYRVPASQGSWVALTSDHRGRLVASDQEGQLYLIKPAPLAKSMAETLVQPLPVELGKAQGLACVNGDLYVMVNSKSGPLVSGLHRARDLDGDGLWETAELLRALPGTGGEHGPHAVIADHLGKSLFVCAGNDSPPPAFDRVRPPGIGRVLVGRIIDQKGGLIRIATDLTDPKRSEFAPLADVEALYPAEVSPMPGGLIDVLDDQELVDLIAFLREGAQK